MCKTQSATALRTPFEEPVKFFFNILKVSRVRGKFQILPTDGVRKCWLIGLDRRQLGLVKEERQIVDHGHGEMKKKKCRIRPTINPLALV